VWQRLSGDASLLSLMGLDGADAVTVAERIIKKRLFPDEMEPYPQVHIYYRPSRKSGVQDIFEHVLEVDVHVPIASDAIAWKVLQRVVQLLHNQRVNNRCLYAEPPLGELPTMSGFFCAGSRFGYYNGI
jgi:hypothetical protein